VHNSQCVLAAVFITEQNLVGSWLLCLSYSITTYCRNTYHAPQGYYVKTWRHPYITYHYAARATAIGNKHKQFGKVWSCGFRVMRADTQTNSLLITITSCCSNGNDSPHRCRAWIVHRQVAPICTPFNTYTTQHPKQHLGPFSHFCRAHGRDQQTDRQTHRQTMLCTDIRHSNPHLCTQYLQSELKCYFGEFKRWHNQPIKMSICTEPVMFKGRSVQLYDSSYLHY